MDRENINSSKAPESLGLYPHAKRVGSLLFLSGIGPRERGTKKIPGVELDETGNIISSYKTDLRFYYVMPNLFS